MGLSGEAHAAFFAHSVLCPLPPPLNEQISVRYPSETLLPDEFPGTYLIPESFVLRVSGRSDLCLARQPLFESGVESDILDPHSVVLRSRLDRFRCFLFLHLFQTAQPGRVGSVPPGPGYSPLHRNE